MENTPTVPNNELEQRYIRYKDVIKELTIMNDIFMRNVFKKRECIEHVLRIIMEMKNLQVLDYTVQKDYRCAKFFKDGDFVNLGIGVPLMCVNYLPEGVDLWLEAEIGTVGSGQPQAGMKQILMLLMLADSLHL